MLYSKPMEIYSTK